VPPAALLAAHAPGRAWQPIPPPFGPAPHPRPSGRMHAAALGAGKTQPFTWAPVPRQPTAGDSPSGLISTFHKSLSKLFAQARGFPVTKEVDTFFVKHRQLRGTKFSGEPVHQNHLNIASGDTPARQFNHVCGVRVGGALHVVKVQRDPYQFELVEAQSDQNTFG